jgi:hypothetical protein
MAKPPSALRLVSPSYFLYLIPLAPVLSSVDKVNDTSKEFTLEKSPPVVDRELTAPPFIVYSRDCCHGKRVCFLSKKHA